MKSIQRNLATEENRNFWKAAESSAAEVAQWPDWRRAGINVTQVREEAREEPSTDERTRARQLRDDPTRD